MYLISESRACSRLRRSPDICYGNMRETHVSITYIYSAAKPREHCKGEC
jgi:hypothetical protein